MAKILIGNIKGPVGETGATGKDGPTGPMGPAGPTGQVDANTPIEFEEAQTLQNIESGLAINTIFGRIKKFMGAVMVGAGSTLLGQNLAASRALVTDASGKVGVSAITATELGYLSGLKANINDQLTTLNSESIDSVALTGMNGVTMYMYRHGSTKAIRIAGTDTSNMTAGEEYILTDQIPEPYRPKHPWLKRICYKSVGLTPYFAAIEMTAEGVLKIVPITTSYGGTARIFELYL